MDFNRLAQMLLRIFSRKAMNYGIRQGTKMMVSKNSPDQASPEAKKTQNSAARDTAKRARQAARITRRLGR